jgi:hypothetical protein
MNGSNNERENGKQETFSQGTSVQLPPSLDDNLEEQSEDDNRTNSPSAPGSPCDVDLLPAPNLTFGPDPSYDPPAVPWHEPFIHDTEICLDLPINGEDEGKFLRLRTSVMVRRAT